MPIFITRSRIILLIELEVAISLSLHKKLKRMWEAVNNLSK